MHGTWLYMHAAAGFKISDTDLQQSTAAWLTFERFSPWEKYTLTIQLKSYAGNIRLSLVIALELVTTTLLRSCLAWDNLYIQEKSIIFGILVTLPR